MKTLWLLALGMLALAAAQEANGLTSADDAQEADAEGGLRGLTYYTTEHHESDATSEGRKCKYNHHCYCKKDDDDEHGRCKSSYRSSRDEADAEGHEGDAASEGRKCKYNHHCYCKKDDDDEHGKCKSSYRRSD
mmetsp:Transcript_28072/g.80800  ORF Transcript_28072/g.80800 Transcript_28072/m.80800 type:complete len:134 (+) Transcript_28072:226-627(+)